MGVLLQLGPLYSKHFFKEKVIEIDKYFIGSLSVHYNNNSMRSSYFHNNGNCVRGLPFNLQGGGGLAGWSIYRGQMNISTRRDEKLKFYNFITCLFVKSV